MHSRSRLVAVAALVLSLGPLGCADDGPTSTGPTPPPGPPPDDLALERVDGTYEIPVLVTAPPRDMNRIFVVEKPGRIRIVKNGVLLATPFLDITGRTTKGYEQGLLGLAFAPDFQTSGRFYVTYTTTDGSGNGIERISRFRAASSAADVALPAEEILITIPDPNEYHNAGMTAFGSDGMLYVSIGDGGGADDPYDTGQDTSDLLGSLLRIDVRPSTGYAIPSNNPLGAGSRREIWAYGLRNPWRFTFDRSNGDLYIADVGQGLREEINVATASSGGGRGRNYGWSVKEGLDCHTPPCDIAGLTDPTLEYTHSDGCTVIGGYVYRGSVLPGLQGTYFYADYCSHWVRSFVHAGGAPTDPRTWPGLDPAGNITSFGEDAAGELYLCTESGAVFKIVLPPA
jgi:glucose/arabinose dehydrogenase